MTTYFVRSCFVSCCLWFWAETGDDVKNVEVNFGMLKTLIEVRADLMLKQGRAA